MMTHNGICCLCLKVNSDGSRSGVLDHNACCMCGYRTKIKDNDVYPNGYEFADYFRKRPELLNLTFTSFLIELSLPSIKSRIFRQAVYMRFVRARRSVREELKRINGMETETKVK